jgi:antitoxin HicB
MTLYKLPLVLDPQPEGGYVVTCPLVPELLTEGDTVQEALHNANDALEAVIEGYEDLGRPLGLERSEDRHLARCRPIAGAGLERLQRGLKPWS